MKKILMAVVCICSVFCSFIFGFYYCKEKVIHGKSNEIIQSNIERIAIVNLDEGIIENNQLVQYSHALLKFASEYVYVGLSEAKTGLESDSYAAYIIIPADFSKCIASLNGEPHRVKVEYIVNSNLTDMNQLQIEEKLGSFKELLNSNTAYVYLSSVLDEFHDVQDSAEVIIEHDKVDLDNIENINPDDIFNMIEFSDMKQTRNDIENVDLSEYIKKNENELDNIYSEIDKGITDGQKKYQEVTKQYSSVSKAVKEMQDAISTYDSLKDAEGNDIYGEGLGNLYSAIEAHNTDVDVAELGGEEDVKELIEEISEKYIMRAFGEAQKHTDESLKKIQEENQAYIDDKVDEWKEKQEDYYNGLKKYIGNQEESYFNKIEMSKTPSLMID